MAYNKRVAKRIKKLRINMKFEYEKEKTVPSQYCTDSCCDDDNCRCVKIVKGAKVVFIGSVEELKNV